MSTHVPRGGRRAARGRGRRGAAGGAAGAALRAKHRDGQRGGDAPRAARRGRWRGWGGGHAAFTGGTLTFSEGSARRAAGRPPRRPAPGRREIAQNSTAATAKLPARPLRRAGGSCCRPDLMYLEGTGRCRPHTPATRSRGAPRRRRPEVAKDRIPAERGPPARAATMLRRCERAGGRYAYRVLRPRGRGAVGSARATPRGADGTGTSISPQLPLVKREDPRGRTKRPAL